MADLGNPFGGLTFIESDLGDLGDGEYGATKKKRRKKKLLGRGKTRRKLRRASWKDRRAARKGVRASGLTGKERRLAVKAARQKAIAARKAGRLAAGKRVRKPLLKKRRQAEKQRIKQALKAKHRAALAAKAGATRISKKVAAPCSDEGKVAVRKIGRKKIRFICYQGHMVPLKSLPPAVSKALLLAKQGKTVTRSLRSGVSCSDEGKVAVRKIGRKNIRFICYQGHMVPLKSLPPAVSKALLVQARAAKKTLRSSLRTSLPTTSSDAFVAAQDAAAYTAPAAQAYTEMTDMYQAPASYQEESYQAEAYDAGGGSTDSSAYWEGGGTAVSSYAPAAAAGGGEEYADEEYEEEYEDEEGGSKLPLILGGVAVLAALGGVGFYVYKKKQGGGEEEPEFPETPAFPETPEVEGV
jgi:hypothetical protein